MLFFALSPAQDSEAAFRLRDLLVADSFRFSGMEKIFSGGSSLTAELVDALNDRNETVSLNAQLMLRLIGDDRGIEELQRWYEQPRQTLRIVRGPMPVPLREWDYRQIDAILSRPSREWKEDATNYLLALAIDGSPHARELLKKMVDAAGNDQLTTASQLAATLSRSQSLAAGCNVHNPETILRQGAFFLTPEERKIATIKVLAYADEKQLALVRVSRTFGNTFLVVLKQSGTCWKFQSTALYSTNN
jgi:hypothetical protein